MLIDWIYKHHRLVLVMSTFKYVNTIKEFYYKRELSFLRYFDIAFLGFHLLISGTVNMQISLHQMIRGMA